MIIIKITVLCLAAGGALWLASLAMWLLVRLIHKIENRFIIKRK